MFVTRATFGGTPVKPRLLLANCLLFCGISLIVGCAAQGGPIPSSIGAFRLGQPKGEVLERAHLEWLHPCSGCDSADGTAFVEGRYLGDLAELTLIPRTLVESTGVEVEVRGGRVVGIALPVHGSTAAALRARLDALLGRTSRDTLLANGVGLLEWNSAGASLRVHYREVVGSGVDPSRNAGDVLDMMITDPRWDGP